MTRTVLFLLRNSTAVSSRQDSCSKNMTLENFIVIDRESMTNLEDSYQHYDGKNQTHHSTSADRKWTSNVNVTQRFSKACLKSCEKQTSRNRINDEIEHETDIRVCSTTKLSLPTTRQKRRKAANARERSRMRKINTAFNELRQKVPSYTDSDTLSKYDTLLMAQQYICALQELLEQNKEKQVMEDSNDDADFDRNSTCSSPL